MRGAAFSPPERDSGPRFFEASGRFRVLSELGAGGMGVVYEVFDRELGARVALKTLPRASADALLRFKNEFRALSDLQHPNLVTLGELFEEHGQWFFTMELVEGESFVRWARPGAGAGAGAEPDTDVPTETDTIEVSFASTAADIVSAGVIEPPAGSGRDDVPRAPVHEARLRAGLIQLTHGLLALHRAGKVHRDVKPGNVLVTSEGIVKILDFGLVLDEVRDFVWAESQIVGTPAFMAPEQALRAIVGPEADWYAVGALLYLVLTGVPAFAGTAIGFVAMKLSREALAPSRSGARVPPDLDRLCVDLMRRSAAARPDGAEILRRLESAAPDCSSARDEIAFVGRAAELDAILDAFAASREKQMTLLLDGESGVGKSAVASEFLRRLRAWSPNAVVLAGRCYERESLPFKAVDGVVDALSAVLFAMPHAEVRALLPPETALLVQVFPVLARVAAVRALAPRSGDKHGPEALRSRLFDAFRWILHGLAATHRVVIVIDDLHWTDADSLALLRALLRPPDAPRLLFVATLRTGAELLPTEGSASTVVLPGEVRTVHLGGLPIEDARELAEAILLRAGREDDVHAAVIASEARGHPMFIDELVRHGQETVSGISLDDALSARLRRLEGAALRLLRVAVVAGAPLAIGVAARAGSVGAGEIALALAELRGGRLVRTSGAKRSDTLESYHDRVRASVLGLLSAEEQQDLHARLAAALEEGAEADPETLTRHWRAGGKPERAAAYARIAAERAASLFAFNRAAQLYEIARALSRSGPAAAAAGIGLGEMLMCAGRGAEAADAFLEVANALGTEETVALELRRRAAFQLMAAGFFDRGMTELRRVLAAVGLSLPPPSAVALASMMLRRAQVRLRGMSFTLREEADAPAETLRRVDVCWAAVVGLGFVDIVRGLDFQSRHFLLALEAGEPKRICRALGAEISFSAASGTRSAVRTESLLAALNELVTRLGEPPALVAFAAAIEGGVAHFEGRFAETPALVQRAEKLIGHEWTHESSHFEHDSIRVLLMGALTWLGRYREFHARAEQLLAEAEERKHLYVATYVRTGIHTQCWLARGDLEGATARAEDAIRSWVGPQTHVPHLLDILAKAYLAMYAERYDDAYEVMARGWKRVEGAFLLRCQYLRINTHETRARTILALAAVSPRRRSVLLAAAGEDARALAREDAAWSRPLGALVRGGIAALSGDAGASAAHLASAARGFDAAEMAIHAAVARYRLGAIVGGEEGRAMVAAAEQRMTIEGVTALDRFARLLAPGFERE